MTEALTSAQRQITGPERRAKTKQIMLEVEAGQVYSQQVKYRSGRGDAGLAYFSTASGEPVNVAKTIRALRRRGYVGLGTVGNLGRTLIYVTEDGLRWLNTQ